MSETYWDYLARFYSMYQRGAMTQSQHKRVIKEFEIQRKAYDKAVSKLSGEDLRKYGMPDHSYLDNLERELAL